MTNKSDGGPAFPFSQPPLQKIFVGGVEKIIVAKNEQKGMSLRDWFAGTALSHSKAYVTIEELVEDCYKIADAMLKEQNK